MRPDPIPARLPPVQDLLALAEGRLRRQAQFARPLSRTRGGARRALEAGFAGARDALAEVARPAALHLPLPDAGLAGPAAPRLAAELAAGAEAFATLVTLGADPPPGTDPLGGHLRGLMAQQMLYAAARAAQADLRAERPGWTLLRLSQRNEAGGQWDAGAVQRLLGLFGPTPLGVRQTEAGLFLPLHTLLAVVVLRPPAQ